MLDKKITFGGVEIPAYICSDPVKVAPKRKMKITQIAGTNRELVEMEDAWETYEQPYTMFTYKDSTHTLSELLDDIAAKLSKKGWQTLKDGYDTDHYRLACFEGDFTADNRRGIASKFELKFRCRPERFLNSGDTPVSVASGGSITNPTSFDAKPLIHVVGSGSGTVTIGSYTMSFTDMVDYLNIDCDKMNVYRLAAEPRNNLMSGDFPMLKSGQNAVSFSGGITAVTITPKWWTI